ncbi:MAG: PIG-L family deacetylase [Anaerolineae bacterium]|nr:PIG-L family deacetylase [Anaerolineae bacterium]
MQTLLVIFAHPDDESHGPGGTLAKYAAEGVRVHYLCATRGEAGVVESSLLANGEDIADLRARELKGAAAALGLSSISFLGYRDSGMAGSPDNQHPDSLCAAPLDEVAGRIAETIRRVRPDVIITHDEHGWYGHHDHIKCYAATLRAYELLYGVRVGEPGAYPVKAPRLYVSTFSKGLLRIMVRLMPLFGVDPRHHGQNKDIDLVEIASWRIRTTASIRVGQYLASKDRAKAAHASQKPLTQTRRPWLRAVMRRMEATEAFSRLYPPVMPREAVERSLFSSAAQPAWNPVVKEAPYPI